MTKPLSFAAQAVLDAFFASDWEDEPLHANVAHAVRAAADQAVPESCFESDDITAIRQQLLAIADELEAH